MLDSVPENVRNLLAQGLIVVGIIPIVFIVRILLLRVLFQRVRAIASRNQVAYDDSLVDLVEDPVGWLTIALGIYLIPRVLAWNPAFGPGLVAGQLSRTLVIIAVGIFLFRLTDVVGVNRGRLARLTGVKMDEALLPFIRTAAKLIVMALVLLGILDTWGYDITGLIAGLGLGGLAFSLAAQDTLSNLFGFSMIVGDRPFVVGEYIKTSDVEGAVEKVGLRSTRIRQLNQAIVTVPNGKLANSVILNWSRLTKRWIDFTLRISYHTHPDDLLKFMERVKQILLAHPQIQPDSVLVNFINVGDVGLEVLVRGYLLIADWGEFTLQKEVIFLQIMRVIAEMQIGLTANNIIIPSDLLTPPIDADMLEGQGSSQRDTPPG